MSKLYLIPTPIGNLQDITLRALETLRKVDYILCEDTRKTRILLNHFNIQKQLVSHHKFNEHKTTDKIVNDIKSGKVIALVSDAGTPGISDPGYLLVNKCLEHQIELENLPGPSALLPALVNSGLPCEKFCFEGFLPQKKGRQKILNRLKEEERTMVFYESPFRLVKTLSQFAEHFGMDRRVSVSRELTKVYEETIRGSLEEVLSNFKGKTVKGEIVIILEGKK